MQNVCVGEKHARFFQYNNSDLLHEVNKVIDANENNLVIYIKNVMKKNLINKFAPFHAYEGTEDVDFAKELHIVSDNIFIKYKDYRCDHADCSYCIYNICVEPSREEFPLEQ